MRDLVCEDCGATPGEFPALKPREAIQDTEIDGIQQLLCPRCRKKWGRFLSTTYRGERA
jgi:hypothetical protein